MALFWTLFPFFPPIRRRLDFGIGSLSQTRNLHLTLSVKKPLINIGRNSRFDRHGVWTVKLKSQPKKKKKRQTNKQNESMKLKKLACTLPNQLYFQYFILLFFFLNNWFTLFSFLIFFLLFYFLIHTCLVTLLDFYSSQF